MHIRKTTTGDGQSAGEVLEDVHRDFGDESIEQVNRRQEIERLNAKQESGGLSEVEAASIPSGSIFFF